MCAPWSVALNIGFSSIPLTPCTLAVRPHVEVVTTQRDRLLLSMPGRDCVCRHRQRQLRPRLVGYRGDAASLAN